MRYHQRFTSEKTGLTIIEFILAAIFVAILVAIVTKNAETKNPTCEDDETMYGSWQIVDDGGGSLEIGNDDARVFDPLGFAKLLASKTTKGKIRLQYAMGDGRVHGYIIAPYAVVEYDGEEYTGYYLENGKKLMLELLREKRNELAEEIEEIEKRMKELSD